MQCLTLLLHPPLLLSLSLSLSISLSYDLKGLNTPCGMLDVHDTKGRTGRHNTKYETQFKKEYVSSIFNVFQI
jgi:hypothetical protein